jgi:ankyrin repeat protein
MASPIKKFVAPNCGLQIILPFSPETKGAKEPNDSAALIQYSITNTDQFVLQDSSLRTSDGVFKGHMSPTYDVTLPTMARKQAGIPHKATRFAYIYPPPGLGSSVDWPATNRNIKPNTTCDDSIGSEVRSRLLSRSLDEAEDETHDEVLNKTALWALQRFAILGGFVYFDADMTVLSVNSLVDEPTNYSFHLAGPYITPKEVVNGITSLGRDVTIPLESFHEAGYVAKAWARPNETFQSQTPMGPGFEKNGGCFIFIKDDGSAVSYTVFPKLTIDKQGEYETMTDALEGMITSPTSPTFKHTTNQQRKEWRKVLSDILDGKNVKSTKDLVMDGEFRQTILHIAIQCNSNDIAELIRLQDDDNFSFQDDIGWTPLHYACRFSAKDLDLITSLIERYENAVVTHDNYNRYPLHIACSSGASLDVINLLLRFERNIRAREQGLETSPMIAAIATKHLQCLPLHLACNTGAPIDTINVLLDTNIMAVREKSSSGRIPLHFAIQKRLPTEVIAALLKADSSISDGSGMYDGQEQDIFQLFQGHYPLLIACVNGSPVEIVEMLLTKDVDDIIVNYTVPRRNHDAVQCEPGNSEDSTSRRSLLPAISERNAQFEGLKAFHLALKSGSADNTRLLLQKEKEIRTKYEGSSEDINTLKDNEGKTPLHIACKECAEPDIIQILLELDPDRTSLTCTDDYGNTALHYACDNLNAHPGVIKMLLEADYNKYLNADITMACKIRNNQHEIPLSVAIKANAPDNAIVQLLLPHYFSLDGLNNGIMNKLGTRINGNVDLQRKINKLLCKHKVFFVLYLEAACYIITTVLFSYTTHSVIIKNNGLTAHYPVLCICAFYFGFRELHQFITEGPLYLTRLKEWTQITIVGLLVTSLVRIGSDSHINDDEDRLNNLPLYMITTFAVMFDFIFFLRTLSLPFANFIGGVILIAKKLVPFLIVSVVMTLGFVHASYLTAHMNKGNPTLDPTLALCTHEMNFDNCAKRVFTAFIIGLERTKTDLSGFIFGIAVSVLLLNVLIAIISNAWADAGARAAEIYWQGRVQFLSEVWSTLGQGSFGKGQGFLDRAINRIPNVFNRVQYGTISWKKDHPYSQVESMDQYNDPKSHFNEDEAKKILKAHSLPSDIYWIRDDDSVSMKNLRILRSILKWLSLTLLFIILCLLGLGTGGLFWPQDFRLAIISYGTGHFEEEDEFDETKNLVDIVSPETEMNTEATKSSQSLISSKMSRRDTFMSVAKGR